jgi:peptidoglycan-N-acetylglucosamine deacetylase
VVVVRRPELPGLGVLFAVFGARIAVVRRSPADLLAAGIRRLVPPVWAMGLVLVPLMLWHGWPHRADLKHLALWAVPLFEPPTSAWAAGAATGLLGICAVLWLVLVSPLLVRLPRGTLPAGIVVVFALLWSTDHLLGSAPPRADALLTVGLTFAPCWLAGIARARGELRRIRWLFVAPVAVAAVAGGLGWTITHPGDSPFDLAFHPVAYGLYSLGVSLVLLRAAPPVAGLGGHPALERLVNLCAARPVTAFLWQGVAVALSYPVAALLPEDDMGIVWQVAAAYGIVAGLAVAATVLFGWVEDLAARRPVRLRAWREVPASRPPHRIPEWSGPIWFE